jgi:hypothetical protein
MSGQPERWTITALERDPDWEEVRKRAAKAARMPGNGAQGKPHFIAKVRTLSATRLTAKGERTPERKQ